MNDLEQAKNEVVNVTGLGCQAEGSASRGARCEAITWMNSLYDGGDDNPHLRKIYKGVDRFIPVVNNISGAEGGDNTLRVD